MIKAEITAPLELARSLRIYRHKAFNTCAVALQ